MGGAAGGQAGAARAEAARASSGSLRARAAPRAGGSLYRGLEGAGWRRENIPSGAIGATTALGGLVSTGSRLVAVGANPWYGRNDTMATILASEGAVGWTAQSSGTAHGLASVAWSGSAFVAVGGSGAPVLLTSP